MHSIHATKDLAVSWKTAMDWLGPAYIILFEGVEPRRAVVFAGTIRYALEIYVVHGRSR